MANKAPLATLVLVDEFMRLTSLNPFRFQGINRAITPIMEARDKSNLSQRVQRVFLSIAQEIRSCAMYMLIGWWAQVNIVQIIVPCETADKIVAYFRPKNNVTRCSLLQSGIPLSGEFPIQQKAPYTADHWELDCWKGTVLAPFREELHCRILIQYLLLTRLPAYLSKRIGLKQSTSPPNILNKTLAKIARIVVTAGFFGSMHLFNLWDPSDPSHGDEKVYKVYKQAVGAFLDGLLWGVFFEIVPGKRGLSVCIGAHLANNVGFLIAVQDRLRITEQIFQEVFQEWKKTDLARKRVLQRQQRQSLQNLLSLTSL